MIPNLSVSSSLRLLIEFSVDPQAVMTVAAAVNTSAVNVEQAGIVFIVASAVLL